MSISLKELLGSADYNAQTPEIQANLMILLERVNKIRDLWGKPMRVTSGLRDHQDQIRIYTEKGIPEDKIPWTSQHLTGGAVDIYDPDLSLTKWLKDDDSKILVDNQLWCEEGNKNWVHFQIHPPKSGNRWFLP